MGVPLACKTLAILIIGIAPISGLACALCCAHCRADSGAPPRSGASGKVYGHRLLHHGFYEVAAVVMTLEKSPVVPGRWWLWCWLSLAV